VLLVGCSREPWLVAKKDEKAFMGLWSKALHMPLPDYAARRVRRAGVQVFFWRCTARRPSFCKLRQFRPACKCNEVVAMLGGM
jgi:hypothetical protein